MTKYTKRIANIREQLLFWHQHQNQRSFPWKQEKDPYKIWLSEIILQQTRSEQGLPYYLAFINAYPTITDLANAPDDEVYKLWQGLGYYNRCKNLLYTARTIKEQYQGVFPTKYEDILQLKGVGTYTAAAIASFAYQLPHAVLDGNVFRVLARLEGISLPIDSTEGKRTFNTLAHEYLDKKQPHLYNQAIMDFGATICTPAKPLCHEACPLLKYCNSAKEHTQLLLPIKSKKASVKKRSFLYFLLSYNDTLYLQKRLPGDVWAGLFEPYLIEGTAEQAQELLLEKIPSSNIQSFEWAGSQSQKLTHQQIHSHFYKVILKSYPETLNTEYFLDKASISKLAFPKTIISFFNNKYYF